jgi:hypothetical protein
VGMDSPEPSEHDYRECADEGCPAELCRIYKEGRHSGYAAGYVSGTRPGTTQAKPMAGQRDRCWAPWTHVC